MGGEANGGKRDGSSLRRTAKTVNVIVKRKVKMNRKQPNSNTNRYNEVNRATISELDIES